MSAWDLGLLIWFWRAFVVLSVGVVMFLIAYWVMGEWAQWKALDRVPGAVWKAINRLSGAGLTTGGGACPACGSPRDRTQAGHAPHVASPACGVDEVKGRRTGSSEQLHRSGERSAGRSEPLNPLRENNARVKGQGESSSPPAL